MPPKPPAKPKTAGKASSKASGKPTGKPAKGAKPTSKPKPKSPSKPKPSSKPPSSKPPSSRPPSSSGGSPAPPPAGPPPSSGGYGPRGPGGFIPPNYGMGSVGMMPMMPMGQGPMGPMMGGGGGMPNQTFGGNGGNFPPQGGPPNNRWSPLRPGQPHGIPQSAQPLPPASQGAGYPAPAIPPRAVVAPPRTPSPPGSPGSSYSYGSSPPPSPVHGHRGRKTVAHIHHGSPEHRRHGSRGGYRGGYDDGLHEERMAMEQQFQEREHRLAMRERMAGMNGMGGPMNGSMTNPMNGPLEPYGMGVPGMAPGSPMGGRFGSPWQQPTRPLSPMGRMGPGMGWGDVDPFQMRNEMENLRDMHWPQDSRHNDGQWREFRSRMDKLERMMEMGLMSGAGNNGQGGGGGFGRVDDLASWRVEMDRLRRDLLDSESRRGPRWDDRDYGRREENQSIRDLRAAVQQKDREIDQVKQTTNELRRDFEREISRLRTERTASPYPATMPAFTVPAAAVGDGGHRKFVDEFKSSFRQMTNDITNSLARGGGAGGPYLDGGMGMDGQLYQANQAAAMATAAAREAQRAASRANGGGYSDYGQW